MPNVASVLKEEIRRLSRKEARQQVAPLKKSLAVERRAVAGLRKQVAAQSAALKKLGSKRSQAAAAAPTGQAVVATGGRRMLEGWRKDSVRSTRRALAVTQGQFAMLVDVSPLTVSLWETGRSTPRVKQQSAVMGARDLGRDAAHARLGLAPGFKPRRGRPSNADIAARKAAASALRKSAKSKRAGKPAGKRSGKARGGKRA